MIQIASNGQPLSISAGCVHGLHRGQGLGHLNCAFSTVKDKPIIKVFLDPTRSAARVTGNKGYVILDLITPVDTGCLHFRLNPATNSLGLEDWQTEAKWLEDSTGGVYGIKLSVDGSYFLPPDFDVASLKVHVLEHCLRLAEPGSRSTLTILFFWGRGSSKPSALPDIMMYREALYRKYG